MTAGSQTDNSLWDGGGESISTFIESQDAAELISERAAIVDQHDLFSFVPNRPQMLMIEQDTTKRVAAVGANQQGKTTGIVVNSFCHAIGCRPYLPKDHPYFRVRMPNGEPIEVPNKGQMCGEDFPVGIGENLWPTWEEWIPSECYFVKKHERSVPRIVLVDVRHFPWANPKSSLWPYSTIFVHAYQQGRTAFQGVRTHWVLDDEPPPRPVYIEQMRGLIKHGGKWMGAMTCVEAEHMWIYDLFLPPKRRGEEARKVDEAMGAAFRDETFHMVHGTMYDNLKKPDGSGGLEPKNIEEYRKDLGNEEIDVAVRVEGKQLSLLGTEFGRVWDEDIHVLEEHRVPDPDACFVAACDAHPSKPYAITWWEVNHRDEWYCFHESSDEHLDDHDLIAEECKRVEGWKVNNKGIWVPGSGQFEPQMRLIDPLANTHEKGLGMTAIQYYRMAHGLLWTPWTKGDKVSRTKMTRVFLKPGTGPTGRPRMTFSPNCPETIHQIPRYRLRPIKDPTTQPAPTEFLDVDADLVQGVIAVANSGLTFDMLDSMRPGHSRKIVSIYGDGPTRSTAGYKRPVAEEPEEWEQDFKHPFRERIF